MYNKLIISASVLTLGYIITILGSKILKNILKKISSRTKNQTDDYIFKVIIETIKPLGLSISTFTAWNILQLEANIRGVNETILGLFKFILLILIVRLANRIVLKLISSWALKIDDNAVSTMIKSLSPMVRAAIWSIGVVFYLNNMGVQMAALWALLSAGGIGAGLALKEPVQEFFEYITILLDKPFQNGQFIHINGVWAKVERVGVRSTRMRSINGEIIVMSNSSLTNGVISNYAEMEQRRLVHKIGVVYDTKHSKMIKIPEIIKTIVEKTNNAIFDRCHFINFGESSLDFELVYYIPTNDYLLAMNAQQQINLDIMSAFEREGIEFAFPTRTIQINNTPN